MWPPTEIPLTVNEKARLITISVNAWPAICPVCWYSMISNAPRIPKTAPDAPTVIPVGVAISAPAEPARPDTM